MFLRKTFQTSTLFTLGAFAVALRGVLQYLLDRAGRSNNYTDFGLGVIAGVGIGLLLIVAWRNGQKLRGQSGGTNAR